MILMGQWLKLDQSSNQDIETRVTMGQAVVFYHRAPRISGKLTFPDDDSGLSQEQITDTYRRENLSSVGGVEGLYPSVPPQSHPCNEAFLDDRFEVQAFGLRTL